MVVVKVPLAMNSLTRKSIARWKPPGPVILVPSTSPVDVRFEYQSTFCIVAVKDDAVVCSLPER
jgi:hypothetical protein